MTHAGGDAVPRSVQAPHRVSARRVPVVTPTARWAYTLRRFGRYAIWSLPVYAVVSLLGLLHKDPAFRTDPAGYDRYLDRLRFSPSHLIYSVGAAFLGILALVAMAALLAGVRGRLFAAAALPIGLAGATVLLAEVGGLVVQQEAARDALRHGQLDAVVINAQLRGGTGATLVVAGSVALTLAWMLIGVALWRSRALQRSDGVLLILAAPLLYLGGYALHMLPILGAMLLFAAGIGVAWTASRLTPGRQPGSG